MAKLASPVTTPRQLEADRLLAEARRLAGEDKVAQAGQLCSHILATVPDHVGALQLLGVLAMKTGGTEVAIGAFDRASQLDPKNVELAVQSAQALIAGRQPAEAEAVLRKALAMRPRDATIFRELGLAQVDQGRTEDALKSFRKTLSILPYDTFATHMIAALTGDGGTHTYVAELFDSYSPIFDEHLTGSLNYRVPKLLPDLLRPHLPPTAIKALDLGCGTGLVAAELDDLVDEIDGIDIAPEMVRKAQQRSIYRTLAVGDIVSLLDSANFAGPYDLIIAADVFVYIGPLEAVFAAVAKVLRGGGLLVFTIETGANAGITLRSSGRFAHAPDYIEHLTKEHGMIELERRATAIRQERLRDIDGFIYVLQHAEAESDKVLPPGDVE